MNVKIETLELRAFYPSLRASGQSKSFCLQPEAAKLRRLPPIFVQWGVMQYLAFRYSEHAFERVCLYV
jgi:hypothetical protein